MTLLNLRDLASVKSKETESFEQDWLSVLEQAQLALNRCFLTEEDCQQLALASSEPTKFNVIIRLIYSHSKQNPHREPATVLIKRLVNSTPFSMSDWVDAIFYFYQWLNKNNRKVNFLSMLNYLECCSASTDAREPGQTLLNLVKDMLRLFDYEGYN